MSTERKPKLEVIEPKKDVGDIEALFLDTELGDGITSTTWHNIPVDKPKTYFRVHPDPAYRRRTELYTHKIEGVIGETHYIIAPAMRGVITKARPCTLVVCVYRDGSPRLWPLKFPREGEKDNEGWMTARSAAKVGMERWVTIEWVRRGYLTRDAQPGYAPDPDWSKLPPFDEMIRLAFGVDGIIRDTEHPIYRELFGIAPAHPRGDDDL